MEIENSTRYSFFGFGFGFGFGFSSGRVRESEELGVRILSFGWEWTSSWLGVAFRLGCKSTMKGSPSA